MAKTDEDYLRDVFTLVDGIEANITNFSRVYQYASMILKLCTKLTNQAIAAGIRTEAQKIMSSTGSAPILAVCEQIKLIISGPKLLPPGAKIEECITPKEVLKTKRYLSDCQAYASQGNIAEVEKRIQTWPCSDHLHGKITAGIWAGYWHARLTYNLRIMYHWDKKIKTLKYEAIITKNELEKS